MDAVGRPRRRLVPAVPGVTPGGPYDHAYLVSPTPNPALGAVGVLELGAAERRYYRVSVLRADGREGAVSSEASGAPIGVL